MKLHELLAIESNLENQTNKVRQDLGSTFEKKQHLFQEKLVTYTPYDEGLKTEVESQLDLQTTVQKELEWIQQHLKKSLDASYRVAVTNTSAKAAIILEDGTEIANNVPATALLELEKRMSDILGLIKAVPTLDPTKGFQLDSQRGEGVYKARETIKKRTKKSPKVIVKYEATTEHPAQTELVYEDKPIGEIKEQEWSGLITPARKSELINRVEILSRAIRQARSRANDVEVPKDAQIGSALLSYIFEKL